MMRLGLEPEALALGRSRGIKKIMKLETGAGRGGARNPGGSTRKRRLWVVSTEPRLCACPGWPVLGRGLEGRKDEASLPSRLQA
jgi:hypothetical protein